MSEVKRWDNVKGSGMCEVSHGEYVTHADCEALVKERDDLRAACRAMARMLQANQQEPNPDYQKSYAKWCEEVHGPAVKALEENVLASHFVRAAEGGADGEGA